MPMVIEGFDKGSSKGMRMKDKERLGELESSEYWDDASAERHPPVKGGRAIVSVALAREDFQRVAAAAERAGKKTSEFIREAALEKAREVQPAAILVPAS